MFNQPRQGERVGKNYKEMKHSAFILSLIAFAFSIMAFFNFNGRCTSDSALALVSICTTLIVGIKIMDTLKIQKYEDDMKRVFDLESKLENMKARLEELRQHSNIALNANWGITFCSVDPKLSIEQSWKAVQLSLLLEDAKRTNTCINILNLVVKTIEKDNTISIRLKNKCNNSHPIVITDEINKTDTYKIFKDKISDIIEEIEKIIKN